MARSSTKLILFFLLCSNICFAQNKNEIDSLCKLCTIAASDSEKVKALKNLANYYYTNSMTRLGDSVFQEELIAADLSGNDNLMYATLFPNTASGSGTWARKDGLEKNIQIAKRAIEFARSKNNANYSALGYCTMANLLTKKGDPQGALTNAFTALSYIQNVTSDSIKAVIYMQLGDCYENTNDAVNAFTNYNYASDIGLRTNSYLLLTNIYHKYYNLYDALGDSANAFGAAKESLALNREHHNDEGIVNDYYLMAQNTNNELYILKGLALADSLHLNKLVLRFKIMMLSYKMVIVKNAPEAIAYLDQPDLKKAIQSKGVSNYYFTRGEIYKYAGQLDSAMYYMKLAEPDLIQNLNTLSARDLYNEIADIYALKNDNQNAVIYYEKSLELSKDLGEYKDIITTSNKLSKLYEATGNFEKSLSYSKQEIAYTDTLQKKTKERDIALLHVELERKKHDAAFAAEQQKAERTINIQYMAITVVIAVVFVFILFMGFFPVSKFTIKMLGYFFFISVFEFLVMLIDNNILWKFTHGQPLKLWLIKIGLIACLVPLQHQLEHRMIQFLESRKLLNVKKRFSIMKIWKRKPKPAPVLSETGIEKIEEDTAVL